MHFRLLKATKIANIARDQPTLSFMLSLNLRNILNYLYTALKITNYCHVINNCVTAFKNIKRIKIILIFTRLMFLKAHTI